MRACGRLFLFDVDPRPLGNGRNFKRKFTNEGDFPSSLPLRRHPHPCGAPALQERPRELRRGNRATLFADGSFLRVSSCPLWSRLFSSILFFRGRRVSMGRRVAAKKTWFAPEEMRFPPVSVLDALVRMRGNSSGSPRSARRLSLLPIFRVYALDDSSRSRWPSDATEWHIIAKMCSRVRWMAEGKERIERGIVRQVDDQKAWQRAVFYDERGVFRRSIREFFEA